MTKIKLNDRVKHVDGRIGTVIYDDGGFNRPFLVLWDGSYCPSYHSRDASDIAEVIGKRYFVDTPFEIGETYETNGGEYEETVVSAGLLCRDQNGTHTYRSSDGTCSERPGLNLILPALKPEPKPCEGREVEVDGVKYRLVPVESEE